MLVYIDLRNIVEGLSNVGLYRFEVYRRMFE